LFLFGHRTNRPNVFNDTVYPTIYKLRYLVSIYLRGLHADKLSELIRGEIFRVYIRKSLTEVVSPDGMLVRLAAPNLDKEF
jgi:hypothetical protein